MDALVVVHTEIDYVRNDRDERGRIRRLFNKIGREVGKYIAAGDTTYFLAEKSLAPNSDSIYPEIRKHFPAMRFVPMGSDSPDAYMEQCLIAKKLLMKDGATQIVLAGVSRDACVTDLCEVLIGEDGHNISRSSIEYVAKHIGWTKEEFDRTFDTHLNACIGSGLTD